MKLVVCTQVVDKNHPILGFFVGWLRVCAAHFDTVHVICLEEGAHDLPAHVHVYSLGKERGAHKIPQAMRFMWYFARAFFTRPQYILFHMGAIYNVLAAPFFMLRIFTGTRFYWWKAHGGTTRFEKGALWFVDRVFTPTQDSFPVTTKKKRVVGHAVDTDVFIAAPRADGDTHALFVGRVMPVKRVDIVVDFVHATDIPAKIVGPADDAAYLQKLLDMIETYGLTDRIEFVGSLTGSDLARAYQDANVVLNPSETGSVDKVVLEALSCGTPVLAPCSTYQDILGQFDLCVPENTSDAYVAAYRRLAETDAQLLHEYVATHHSLHTLPQRIFGSHIDE